MKKILFSLVVLSLLIGGYSVLAQNNNLPSSGITPDSPFYFLKSWKETIQLFFTFGAENKAKQYLHLADVRLAEYQKMVEKGKTEIAQRTLDKYEKQLNHALEKIEELKNKGKDTKDISQKVEDTLNKHIEVLQINLQKVPESSKEGIERALETSREGIEKVGGRIEEEQKEEMIEIPKETNPEEEKPEATCQNECSGVGLKRCYNIGNYGYQTCGNYDPDSCLEWSSTTICPSDTITCQDGICIQQGQKEQKCSDGTLYNQCSANKPFYCENGNLIDKCSTCGCPSEKQCQSNGSCTVSPQATCQNECSSTGSKRCSDNGYQVCGNYDADECLEWGSTTNCSVNTICQDGNCVVQQKCSDGTLYGQCSTNKPKYCDNGNLIDKCATCNCPSNQACQTNGSCRTAITCQNECSPADSKRCSNNGYQTCGNYDEDSCLEWGSIIMCSSNTVCQNGNCIQQKCTDGTLYDQCSINKPKYCDNGNLIDKCSLCGCLADYFCDITFECKRAGALIRPIKIGVIEFAPKDVQYGKLYHCKGGSIYPLQQAPVYGTLQLTQQDCPEGIEEYNFLEIFNNPAGVLYFEDVSVEYLPHSVYYIDEWLNNEALKYNKTIKINLEVKGPYTLTESPPNRDRRTSCALLTPFFNKKAEENGINLENYDLVNYVYFDDHLFSQRQYQGFVSCAELLAIPKTTFSNVETWEILGDKYLHQDILHELVHALGAQDTYLEPCPRGNYWSCCKIPEGIPEPNKVPIYPQTKACLMCGSIQLKEDGEGLQPANLSFITLCETTAKEIGFIE